MICSLGLGLVDDLVDGGEVGDVDGPWAGVLDGGLSHELVDQLLLAGEHLQHALVHRLFEQEAMDLDPADLAHAMTAGDRLCLHCRPPLRLAPDHDRRSLDVQSDPSSFDLRDEGRPTPTVAQGIDHSLPLRR
jgi:hypothetical protein